MKESHAAPAQLRLHWMRRHMKEKMNHAQGHGEYREIVEEEFLKEVCGSEYVIVHFYHLEFLRCKVGRQHLPVAARPRRVHQMQAVPCSRFSPAALLPFAGNQLVHVRTEGERQGGRSRPHYRRVTPVLARAPLPRPQVMDKHLRILAHKYGNVKFLYLNAEKVQTALASRHS